MPTFQQPPIRPPAFRRMRKVPARGACPTEHAEQCAVITWAAMLARGRSLQSVALRNLFAIPNGGHRSKAAAGKLKAEGVQPGVPDLFLAWPWNGRPGLFIEMKRAKGGSLSAAQKDWHERLIRDGYAVVTCKGSREAIAAIEDYLKPASAEDDE